MPALGNIDEGGGWLILRCRGRATLRLAAGLNAARIQAWAPSRVKGGKVPKRRARVVLRESLCAGYVFATAAEAQRLRELEVFSGSLPRFDLFRDEGRIPVIADSQLEGLRAHEAHEDLMVRRRQRHTWERGQHVRVTNGPAAGHVGTIEAVRGKFVMLTVKGKRHPLKIASFLLEEEGLNPQRIAA